MPNLIDFAKTYLTVRLLTSYPANLAFKIVGGWLVICLCGCSSLAESDQSAALNPASGGLFDTLQALQSGAYERHLQLRGAELKSLQLEQTKQHIALADLKEQQVQLQQEKNSLTQASVKHAKQAQAKQFRIQSLKQQHTELLTQTQNVQSVSQQMTQTIQQQAQQRATDQQRLANLLAERERLRQALKALINSDS